MTTKPSDRRLRIVLALVIVAVSIFVVARAARKGSTSTRNKTHGALERNYEFAGRLIRGEDPYAKPPLHAPYPPSYGIVMAPLRLLPLMPARIAWAVFQLLCLFLLIAHLRRFAGSIDATRGPPLWVFVGAVFLVLRYLSRDTSGGGGNLVWGTLVFLAVIRPGEAPGTDERPWRGLLLGIVLAAKPTPVLFLPWLWWRGRRQTCAIALGTAALLHLSPILTLGTGAWAEAYAHWFQGVLAYSRQADLFALPSSDFPPFSWMHQSLRFAVLRFFGTVPSEHVLDSPLWFNGLGLAVQPLTIARRALEFAILGVTLGVLYRARKRSDPWIEVHAVGLLVCTTLLLSPIAWKSYHLWHLPFFAAILLGLAFKNEYVTRRRREIVVGLALYWLFCQLASELVLGDHGKELMQSLYVVTFGALWLWTLAFRFCLQRPQSRS